MTRLAPTLLTLLILAIANGAAACPFCSAVRPTVRQRCDAATLAVLAEVESRDGETTRLVPHAVLNADGPPPEPLAARLSSQPAIGSLVLAIRTAGANGDARWQADVLDEAAFAYVAGSPSLRVAAAKRLTYFARFLNHANGWIAEDAFAEFAHAPFEDVAAVGGSLPQAHLREWLASRDFPEDRKGFLGLALAFAPEEADREANRRLLRRLAVADREDFRAGFDGVLGGYLLLAPDEALRVLDERFLGNPQSRDGDVRHALSALRFYQQYGKPGDASLVPTLAAKLLDRPEFSAEIIADLARWQAWESTDRIVALYDRDDRWQPATRRAVIRFLLASPEANAAEHLARLKKLDPQGVAAAESAWPGLGDS